jgi:hypothetical protein
MMSVVRVAGLAGILVSVPLVAVTMLPIARAGGILGWTLLWLTWLAFGAGVIAPLWSLPSRTTVVVRDELRDTNRSITIAAPHRGRFRLELHAGATDRAGTWVVNLRIGDTTQRIEGRNGSESSLFEIAMARAQTLEISLERGETPIAVTLQEPPPPLRWYRLAAMLAAVLAAVADASGARRDRRGLSTAVVASACIYAVALGSSRDWDLGSIGGLVLASLTAGGVFAAVAVGVLGVARRKR